MCPTGGPRTFHQRRLLRPGGEADRGFTWWERWRATHASRADLGIGGIANWRDAPSSSARLHQRAVCTAAMHYGFRIVEDMVEGLSKLYRREGHEVGERNSRPRACRVHRMGRSRSQLQGRSACRNREVHRLQLCYVACKDGSVYAIHNVDEPLHPGQRGAAARCGDLCGRAARNARGVGGETRVAPAANLARTCARCRAASRWWTSRTASRSNPGTIASRGHFARPGGLDDLRRRQPVEPQFPQNPAAKVRRQGHPRASLVPRGTPAS